jgi:phospholipase/lecithinase/hemolysin
MRSSNMSRRWVRLASSVAFAVLSCSALAQPSAIDRLVVFGTSLSDTGNSFYWLSRPDNVGCGTPLNVPPYAALDELLTPDGPYAKGGHHVSNGATWAEGVARGLALAGNARPALANAGTSASNYAVFGARAVAVNCRFNLLDQVSAYLADFPQASASTLVAIEIGSNDVRDALTAGPDAIQTIQNALGGVIQSVTLLHQHGVRSFVFLNVPDVGKTPAVRMLEYFYPGTMEGANKLAMGFNKGLLDGVVPYVYSLGGGSQARIVDIYETLNLVVEHKESYGFVNVTDACVTPNRAPFQCTNPDSYLFWDGIHPTKAMHAIIAQQALAVISAAP